MLTTPVISETRRGSSFAICIPIMQVLACVCCAMLLGATGQAAVMQLLNPVPLAFEPNAGQVGRHTRFLACARGYRVALSPEAATIEAGTAKVQLRFLNSLPMNLEVLDPLPGVVNYLTGNDRSRWLRRIPTYARIRARNVYKGIDVVFRGSEGSLEYDFTIAPGADVSRIGLGFTGVRAVRIDKNGDVVLDTEAGEIRQKKPMIYQESDGVQTLIDGHYIAMSAQQVAFEVSGYDRERKLVIDPELVFAVKVGGYHSQQLSGIALDSQGNIYVTGTAPNASQQVLVTKLDPSGQNVLYATYIGGWRAQQSTGIAVDASGAAYVTGTTESPDFPITQGAVRVGSPGPNPNAFVFKLDPGGHSLVYSALPAGSLTQPAGIAVDAQGNAYITGGTIGDLPVTQNAYWSNPPVQPPCCGIGPSFPTFDGFVLKLDSNGTGISYATYANKPIIDSFRGGANAIAVDSAGDAYITGPGFVLKFNPTGSGLVYSAPTTPWGVFYTGNAITIDTLGNAYVTGTTDYGHAFVTRLDPKGNSYFNTGNELLRGEQYEWGQAIGLDGAGHVFVTGTTASSNFRLRGPVQEAFAYQSGFLAELDSSGKLLFSTYVGDADNFRVSGMAIDATGRPLVCGNTNGINYDAWIAKYDTSSLPELRLDSLANLASQMAVPVSPGELVGVNGEGFGPDTQLFFDNIPPTIALSSTKTTAIVPDALAGKTFATVHVESGGQRSNPVLVPVAPAAPGIFTENGEGTGQALALNEDGTPNSPDRPAAPGSMITFYATGVGQTPTGISVYLDYSAVSNPQFSAGPAPGFSGDVLKVRVRIPPAGSVPPGLGILALSVGGVLSQQGVIISIGQ